LIYVWGWDVSSLSEDTSFVVVSGEEISEAWWFEALGPVWVCVFNFVVIIEVNIIAIWDEFRVGIILQEINEGSLEGLHVLVSGDTEEEGSTSSVSWECEGDVSIIFESWGGNVLVEDLPVEWFKVGISSPLPESSESDVEESWTEWVEVDTVDFIGGVWGVGWGVVGSVTSISLEFVAESKLFVVNNFFVGSWWWHEPSFVFSSNWST